MKRPCYLLLLLAAAVLFPARLPAEPSAAAKDAAGAWRRTVQGWEQNTQWLRPPLPPPQKPAVHPMALGAMVLLLGVSALAALPTQRNAAGTQPAKPVLAVYRPADDSPA